MMKFKKAIQNCINTTLFLTLQGDSGGPLHKVMDDGRMKQIGITSFGLALGCELGFHGAFTRTSKARFI